MYYSVTEHKSDSIICIICMLLAGRISCNQFCSRLLRWNVISSIEECSLEHITIYPVDNAGVNLDAQGKFTIGEVPHGDMGCTECANLMWWWVPLSDRLLEFERLAALCKAVSTTNKILCCGLYGPAPFLHKSNFVHLNGIKWYRWFFISVLSSTHKRVGCRAKRLYYVAYPLLFKKKAWSAKTVLSFDIKSHRKQK